MTNAEIDAGAAALEAYAEGESWRAHFAPAGTWHEGSIAVLNAADKGDDQTPIARLRAGVAGLHAALRSVGHEDEMTPQQYHDAAAVVLAACHKVRGR